MQPRRSPRPLAGGLALALTALILTGCTQTPAPDNSASASASSASVSPTPSETPPPTLQPDGSAADNLPFFTQVVEQVWSGADRMSGRAYIDALVAAGFDKERMQVTKDQTAIGNAADSIQFSVAWGDECLIGQAGAAFAEPVTVVLRALEGGSCLVGDTRPIDW